jgi:hypothetical protein
MIYHYSQLLRSIDQSGSAKTWRSNNKQRTVTLCLQLFDQLIAYECQGIFSDEILKLINQCLVDSLDYGGWTDLVFEIQKTYLTQSISISKQNLNELYNQKRVIQALDQISIPLTEFIDYLQKQLNIQGPNVQEEDLLNQNWSSKSTITTYSQFNLNNNNSTNTNANN